MPEVILPESLAVMLLAFEECFTAPSFHNFTVIVAGWLHCLGRRTITAVALASGGIGERHISVFHRFFARATWSLDAVGQVLFRLALRWVPDAELLFLPLDDTLARKGGKCIALASIHHDPLLSTRKKPFFSFGHCWVVFSLWLPLPMFGTGFALPLLFRLYVGRKRGGERDAPSQKKNRTRLRRARRVFKKAQYRTKLELAREMVGLLASWAPERRIYVVCDSAYAGRTLLEGRPQNVHVISRLRMDAALYALPPARKKGQRGRARRRGKRLPTPKRTAQHTKKWLRLEVGIYGRRVKTLITERTALWYVALRHAPVKIVIVRDPKGHRLDEAFFCTDTNVDATFVLEGFGRRWCLEVTFHDVKQFLGFEDAQNQTEQAVRRTAPMACIVYDLVVLWYSQQIVSRRLKGWLAVPWYRGKSKPSFCEMLTAARRAGWRVYVSDPPSRARRRSKSITSWHEAVLATA
jgi:hypothetical protein